MEVSDYLLILRRHWRTVLAVTLVGVIGAVVLSALAPREYRAETRLFVSTAAGESVADLAQGGSFTQRQVATYAYLVTTPIVLDPVVADLGLQENAASLASRTTATVAPDTVLISIAVTDDDPNEAAEVANVIAEQFAETIEELEQAGDTGTSPVNATVVQPATAPQDPTTPQPMRNLVIGLALGLLLGLGAALLKDRVDTRIRSEDDVRRVTHAPTIGMITFDADAEEHPLIGPTDRFDARAEAFRALRTNLRYIDADNPPRALVVTSTVPGEGKSTSTANLALTLASSEVSVCLIEGDLRRPRVLDYLGLENAVGLTDVLVGRADIQDVLQPYGNDGLSVLGCGPIPPNPSELLGSQAMSALIGELRDKFDYVIVDSPPLLAVTDAAVLANQVDGTVVVIGAGLVRREQLQRALANLERVGADVLGVVLNRLPGKGPDSYSYSYDTPDSHAVETQHRGGNRLRARRRGARARRRSTRGGGHQGRAR